MKVHFASRYLFLTPEPGTGDLSSLEMLRGLKGISFSRDPDKPVEYRWELDELFGAKKARTAVVPPVQGIVSVNHRLSTGCHIVSFFPKDDAGCHIVDSLRDLVKAKTQKDVPGQQPTLTERFLSWLFRKKKTAVDSSPLYLNVTKLYTGPLPVLEIRLLSGPLAT